MKNSVFVMIQSNYNFAAAVAASMALRDRAYKQFLTGYGGGVEDLTHSLPLVFGLLIDSRMR